MHRFALSIEVLKAFEEMKKTGARKQGYLLFVFHDADFQTHLTIKG